MMSTSFFRVGVSSGVGHYLFCGSELYVSDRPSTPPEQSVRLPGVFSSYDATIICHINGRDTFRTITSLQMLLRDIFFAEYEDFCVGECPFVGFHCMLGF